MLMKAMLILSECESVSNEDCAVHVRVCGIQTLGRRGVASHEHCRDSHGLYVQGLSAGYSI
jgi:hypothetical protein